MTTDKVEGGYLPTYLRIAARLGPAASVLELGVDKGESLELWQALFPNGTVTGVDINPDAMWPPGTTRVVGDAADPGLPFKLGGSFDLIVDDCSHQGPQVLASFGVLWPLLNPGGYYTVEDWMIGLPGFRDHPMHNVEMLAAVQWLITRLSSPGSEVAAVAYRYGLAVVRKRRNG